MTHPWYKAAESEPVEAMSRCGHVVTLMAVKKAVKKVGNSRKRVEKRLGR